MKSRFYFDGMYTFDGDSLPDHIVRAAYSGSSTDLDICHFSVRTMFKNSCRQINILNRNINLENGIWFTTLYDTAGRYADDIMRDWICNGHADIESLFDITSAYIRRVNETIASLPKRHFTQDDFTTTVKYGYAPKSIYPPRRTRHYVFGEGHTSVCDAVTHPVIIHEIKTGCAPNNLSTHKSHGCNIGRPATRHNSRIVYGDIDIQPLKHEALIDAVRCLNPESAYIYRRHMRHDIFLAGIDSAEAFKIFDDIQKKFGTPVGCFVTKDASTVISDGDMNEGVRIISNGKHVIGKRLRARQSKTIPRLAAVSNNILLNSLDANGFEIIVCRMPRISSILRAEYTLAVAQFSGESRFYMSAIPVLLCSQRIDWDLMLCLARTYCFAGTLYGMLVEMSSLGYHMEYPLRVCDEWGIKCADVESDTVKEMLRIYKPVVTA